MLRGFVFFVPAAVSFLVQSLLCRRVKRGMLRYGAVIFTVIPVVGGCVTLLTQYKGMFGGLGTMAAVLWFANACSAAFGYGAAWMIFFASKKFRSRKRKGCDGL